jgi:hypothetical protein
MSRPSLWQGRSTVRTFTARAGTRFPLVNSPRKVQAQDHPQDPEFVLLSVTGICINHLPQPAQENMDRRFGPLGQVLHTCLNGLQEKSHSSANATGTTSYTSDSTSLELLSLDDLLTQAWASGDAMAYNADTPPGGPCWPTARACTTAQDTRLTAAQFATMVADGILVILENRGRQWPQRHSATYAVVALALQTADRWSHRQNGSDGVQMDDGLQVDWCEACLDNSTWLQSADPLAHLGRWQPGQRSRSAQCAQRVGGQTTGLGRRPENQCPRQRRLDHRATRSLRCVCTVGQK